MSLFENIPIFMLITKYVRNGAARARWFIYKNGDALFGINLLYSFFISVWDKLFERNDYTFVAVAAASHFAVWGLNKIAPAKVLKWVGLGMK